MAADKLVGGARAMLGQGVGMGWGDEGEAWLRSKLGQGKYDDLVKQIRSEYGQYSKENPKASTALEFTGGVAPGLAAMAIPGGQAAGAAQLARTGAGAMARMAASPLARMAATGATTGAVAGAGSADDGDRVSGGIGGGLIGGGLGVAMPLAMRGGTAAVKWLRDRLIPSEASISTRANEKMTQALRESGMQPSDVAGQMAQDAANKIPSVVANANPALADLAEAVAQRTGTGARKVEKTLTDQRLGARERSYQQTAKALQPGNYYSDVDTLTQNMRARAKAAYDAAYDHGAVDDPRINEALQNPAFKGFFDKAKQIADTEATAAKLRGEDPSKYALKEIYTPKLDAAGNQIGTELSQLPDVRTLDYVKKGIDASIESGYASSSGMSKSEATALKGLKKEFLNAVDENVPAYKAARAQFAGDLEVKDAMTAGMNDFNKMDHEQVSKAVAGMTDSEKDAFRTGVARHLYGRIMDPSGNFNAAQRIIGSPETQAKLQPLFESADKFNLFKNAMEREAQLFQQSNRVLGGSQTGKRMQMRDNLESGDGMGDAIAGAVTGGFWPSLTGMAARALRSGDMTDQTAAKLAGMLMSKDPHEVAAVVQTLEDHAAKAVPRAKAASAAEMGAVTGTAAAIPPAPAAPDDGSGDMAKAAVPGAEIDGPDIEADLAAREAAAQK